MPTIKEVAHEIENRLLSAGVIIQRYNAYTTGSIYLKFDYGLANSIRISDHTGKKHLSYMFNIGSDIETPHTVRDKFTRYYYPISALDEAVRHILRHRERRIMQFSNLDSYSAAMFAAKEINLGNKGFWSKAYIVGRKKRKKRNRHK